MLVMTLNAKALYCLSLNTRVCLRESFRSSLRRLHMKVRDENITQTLTFPDKSYIKTDYYDHYILQRYYDTNCLAYSASWSIDSHISLGRLTSIDYVISKQPLIRLSYSIKAGGITADIGWRRKCKFEGDFIEDLNDPAVRQVLALANIYLGISSK